MMCQDVMKPARYATPETTIRDAAITMRDDGVGFLPVCDERGRVLGTVTDRDITIRAVATGEQIDKPVATIMTPQVVACRPTDDLSYAEELMSQAKVSRIMCVNEQGLLEGVISLSDIVQVDDTSRAASTLRNVSEREARV
jgi:CBS domain-containing protein